MQKIGEDVVRGDVCANKGKKEKGNNGDHKRNNRNNEGNNKNNEFLESMTPIRG